MQKIFVSYASEDRSQVQHLVSALKYYGYDVWWDQEIAGGQPYREVINGVLAEVDCVISVWSEASVESDWVIGEAELAFRQDKLIPVSMDGTQPPIDFRQLHILNLNEWFERPLADDLPRLIQSIEKITKIGTGKRVHKLPLYKRIWDRIRFSGWGFKLTMLVITLAIVFYPDINHRLKVKKADDQIVSIIRGEFANLREVFNTRDHQPSSMAKVLSDAPKVGDRLKAVPDEYLLLARRVMKYEYIGWSFVMEAMATVEDGRSTYPVDQVNEAIQSLSLAEELESELQEERGDVMANRMHAKIVKHLEDYNSKDRIIRIHAIAYALRACFGNEDAHKKVNEQMDKLSKSHLKMYPVVNEFLKYYFVKSEGSKNEESRPPGCI